MIRFISLTMRNFLSYGNNTTVVQLDRPGTTLILGEDLDNTSNGQGANGVGKTVIINAICYGLYDKSISSISKDNLVNNINKKNMEVTVTFEKNGTYYMIRRVRKSKAGAAGNYVQFYEKVGSYDFTEKDETTRDSVSNTSKYIVEILGIPYDLFVRIVVFSANHIPFLDLPIRHPTQTCQTAIIEELFDLTTLTEKAELLKLEIKESETKLVSMKSTVRLLENEHSRHGEQIKSAQKRVVNWEKENQNNIKSLKSKLEKVSEVDFEAQRRLHTELDQIDDDLADALKDQRECELAIKKATKNKKSIFGELEHLRDAKCPYCLQKYENSNEKIKECEDQVKEYDDIIEEQSGGLELFDASVTKLTKQRKSITKNITVNNLEELLEVKNESANIEARIREMEDATNPFIEALDELENADLSEIDYEKINELDKLIEHQRFLLKLLTKKDSFVRKVLLNKNIPFLNTRLQQYLSDLGLPHTVEFTHELTAEITQFGRPMDFGNLSNGQRARVNLALSFAFRDVLQSLHDKMNVCLLDEVLDVGLDSVGVQNAARMLKRKARDEKLSLYIISHRDEIGSAFDSQMVIQMSKGFSYIKEE